MVATLGQRLDDQGVVISDPEAANLPNANAENEALIKGKGDKALKYHVNAIIDDDLWQVVKAKKLQEENFEVCSSMSFGSSHWCRSTPRDEHLPMESGENRPTHPVKHQLTPSIESVGSCETVRIMTHKEFVDQHPHPSQPYQPMIIDQATEGQTLRRQKEEISKHLRREANEEEMNSFKKGETKETEKDTERMFHQAREKMKRRVILKKKESESGKFLVSYLIGGIDYPCSVPDPGSWKLGGSSPSLGDASKKLNHLDKARLELCQLPELDGLAHSAVSDGDQLNSSGLSVQVSDQ
ncbi:hypothetical protein IGI04_029882 [Brassica rapa subsp. trilocularis]|uniref:Uncharacterized protein n=1 Tax=Brassica rapa subsp. trilocularis TaxID=1813537 RepID=A0ABQ7LT14_BRACM|nr:hypothetical protein IGI04_029882 [Brassica rapa subsp. trilocularis]